MDAFEREMAALGVDMGRDLKEAEEAGAAAARMGFEEASERRDYEEAVASRLAARAAFE